MEAEADRSQPSRPAIRLVVFDLDGTLVDSQATIVACATDAFMAEGLEPPQPQAIRRIVGLSLPLAMGRLLGREDVALSHRIAEAYRAAFLLRRAHPEFDEPLFPGIRPMLETLERRGVLMGVATGKAMRGLRSVLEHHGLERFFVTLQTADLHPSKPDPSMVLTAMAEAGTLPHETMMVGDTSFDIEMAITAAVHPVGVAWGNHPAAELTAAGAPTVLGRIEELLPLVEQGPAPPGAARALPA